ncbi:MAG: twin-arginine translocase TatA/TatE family subunit [Anaerolineae bacterium]|nr:twin-arginine translocase TatA/TatE family subunit [Anaerolineae bacterium]
MPLRNFGLPELIIILVIVLLVFGVGRVSKVGKELGTAISEFRTGLKSGMKDDDTEDEDESGPTE